MNCYIFDIHIDCCFIADRRWDSGIIFYCHDLLEIGPLNMICSGVLSIVKSQVRAISSLDVPVNWWTEFSSWQDFRGLLRTGTKLAIHEIVENFCRSFVALENIGADIVNIEENGNVEIVLSEDNEYILQSFTLRASRKRLRRLKDIAAYNVGQCLVCESDVDHIILPQTLQILVKKFIILAFTFYILLKIVSLSSCSASRNFYSLLGLILI